MALYGQSCKGERLSTLQLGLIGPTFAGAVEALHPMLVAPHPRNATLALPLGRSSGPAAVAALDGSRFQVIQPAGSLITTGATFWARNDKASRPPILPPALFPNMVDVILLPGPTLLDDSGEGRVGGKKCFPGLKLREFERRMG